MSGRSVFGVVGVKCLLLDLEPLRSCGRVSKRARDTGRTTDGEETDDIVDRVGVGDGSPVSTWGPDRKFLLEKEDSRRKV